MGGGGCRVHSGLSSASPATCGRGSVGCRSLSSRTKPTPVPSGTGAPFCSWDPVSHHGEVACWNTRARKAGFLAVVFWHLHRAANPGQEWGSAPGRSPPREARTACPCVDHLPALPECPPAPFLLGSRQRPRRVPSCPHHSGFCSFFPSDLKAPPSCDYLLYSPVDGKFSRQKEDPGLFHP